MYRVVIIGGGISGLTIAWELLSRGLPEKDLLVMESNARCGGNILTEKVDNFTIETGPNGFLDNSPPTLDLVRRLGMENRLLPSRESASLRFIFRGGQLHAVPMGPIALLRSSLLSFGGRLRIFREPFVPRGGSRGETVFDFASRRIGNEAASVLVDPMVSGVFAGDARNLELLAAFPRMAEMEEQYGGLVKALLAVRREKRRDLATEEQSPETSRAGGPAGPGGRLTSFREGMEELPRVLAKRLGGALRTGSPIVKVEKGEKKGYLIRTEGGQEIAAETLVLSCPSSVGSRMTPNLSQELSSLLSEIPSAPVTVVATIYRLEDLAEEPWGFGFLVPRGEGVRALGCLWTSSIWENRAPEGFVLLRTMVGGAHDPDAFDLDDDTLLTTVARDLQETMGLRARPVLSKIYRHKLGIAQYTPGHTARRGQIDEVLKNHPGLLVSGSSYGGISVNHCIAEAPAIAERIMANRR